ncbi:MAG: restriction endonuclease subunit S [Faecalibacterium prausnitzii]|nr:restriction endonuclease subunit S [Faecalibacterium prausnitzii]
MVTDGSHTSPKSVSHGKYMVSVKDFTPYGFDFNGCRQISFADYEKLKSSGCVPQKGDILIGKDGARYFEDIIIYNQDEAPALLSSIAILRCDEEKVIPEYLYYLLKTPSFKKDVKDNYGSGSAIPRIILKDFKRMKVEYPSIEKQRQIVSILHDLDAKIFNNQKVNDNLEQQAAALFSSLYNRSNTEVRYTDLIQILGGGTPKTGETAYWNGNMVCRWF